jgi:hypothetical protein
MDERLGGRPSAREAALARAARVKRWVAGGAVALTGIFSAVAAHALPASHANKAKPAPAAPVAPSVEQGGDDQRQPTPIAPPAQVPQPSSSAGGGAVSGGS